MSLFLVNSLDKHTWHLLRMAMTKGLWGGDSIFLGRATGVWRWALVGKILV